MLNSPVVRRQFLKQSCAGAAVLLAGQAAAASVPSERIVLGWIGAGGRGRALMKSFETVGGSEVAAVCDVYDDAIAKALKIAGPKTAVLSDHRALLDRKDIDAVVIATPDHWHYQQLADAVAAGKDVYLEKPMSWSLEQGKKMVELVRSSDRIVQVGMQRRSSPGIIAANQLVDRGVLGEVNFVQAQWFWNMPPLAANRPLVGKLDWARFRGPYSSLELDAPQHARFFNWRYFWDFSGGNMTDQGTHLMDVVQWFLNDGKPPRSAVCQGSVFRLQPAQTPDVFSAVFEYPKFVATWSLAYTNSYQDGWRITMQGNKATMVLDDRGYRVFADAGRGRETAPPIHEAEARMTTEPHLANFLDCVRQRQRPNAPVEVGHYAVAGPHLANIALHKQSKVLLNDSGLVTTAS